MRCYPTEFYSLTGSVAAADFSPPPTLQLIAGDDALISFPAPYELMGITMTSTLTNFGTAIMGVFVVIGQDQKQISYARSTPAPIGAVTGTNSLIGPPAVPIPSDKTIATVFLQPKRIEPQTKISLYAFGDNTAGNALAAYISLVMRRVD